jgi:DNA-binding transcriptional ArsR family regulator
LSVNDIVAKLDGKVKQPTVSHHLKELEEAGLVFARQEGRQRFYTLNQEQVSLCCGQLIRAFNLGHEMQIVSAGTVPISSIK